MFKLAGSKWPHKRLFSHACPCHKAANYRSPVCFYGDHTANEQWWASILVALGLQARQNVLAGLLETSHGNWKHSQWQTGKEDKLRILRESSLCLGSVASPPPRWRFLAQLSPAFPVNGTLLMSPAGLHRDDCWAIIDSGSAQWKFTELPDMVNFP